jgi:hypothetical protein
MFYDTRAQLSFSFTRVCLCECSDYLKLLLDWAHWHRYICPLTRIVTSTPFIALNGMRYDPFHILIRHKAGRVYRVLVTHIYMGAAVDRYRIEGRNRYIVLQTDQPFIKRTYKRKKHSWKLWEGQLENMSLFNSLCQGIEQHWARMERENGNVPPPQNSVGKD